MTTTDTQRVIREPSGWLRVTAAAQVRRIRRFGLNPDNTTGPVILAPLVGNLTAPGTAQDRSCDRCGRYCAPGEDYTVILYHPTPVVALVVGLCADHAATEGVTR